jgi:predicted nuclease of predicted toxin-antitoxin system
MWLPKRGHDVVTARELNMQRASDRELSGEARSFDRVMLTRDKDFGTLVYLRRQTGPDVILLRMTPAKMDKVHETLSELLRRYSMAKLQQQFCVVEPDRYRVRRVD